MRGNHGVRWKWITGVLSGRVRVSRLGGGEEGPRIPRLTWRLQFSILTMWQPDEPAFLPQCHGHLSLRIVLNTDWMKMPFYYCDWMKKRPGQWDSSDATPIATDPLLLRPTMTRSCERLQLRPFRPASAAMSATFPFVGQCALSAAGRSRFHPSALHCVEADPFIRLENALWGVFHCRGNKSVVVLTNLWEIWSLQPTLHRQAITLRRALLKVVVLRILRAVNLRCLPIGYLHTLLQFLHSIISGNVLLQHFTKKLDAASTIDQIQYRFSEFTSGWKLCINLCEILSFSLITSQEFAIDGLDFNALQDPTGGLSVADDGTCSVVPVVSTKARSTTRFETKREQYQPTIAKNAVNEDCPHDKFRLKTLEEHRHATRFQEKRVTSKTWRSALREAHKLIESEDRVNLASALYLLLEIIWLDPRGCNLATMYLDSGSIYLAFDHLEEAAKAYRNCLRLDGSNWKARYNLGVATARLQDFVETTRQLKLALKACPADIAEEIVAILQEIDRIQSLKNLRAYKEATKARVFTTQYLESQHLITGKLGVPDLQEDHTVSHRNGMALSSSTPHLLDVSHEWQGALASVLHRLHAFARCRHINVQDEMLRQDPTRTGGISVQALAEVVTRITGIPLGVTEYNELTLMLGHHGATTFHYLNPNVESSHAFDEIQDHGACHALLHWNLYQKRAKRSANSKAGGLWYWFEMTMVKWIEQVLPQRSLGHTISSLIETLYVHGWVTPMDFTWKWRRSPEPDDFPMLQLADRGLFIYECHRAQTCVQEEASRTLQMFLRRFLIKCERHKHARILDTNHSQERSVHEAAFLEDVHTRLARETLLDQQVAREVLLRIEDMVDDVIINHRHQQKKYDDEVQWQEIPVRTEQRQKIMSDVV